MCRRKLAILLNVVQCVSENGFLLLRFNRCSFFFFVCRFALCCQHTHKTDRIMFSRAQEYTTTNTVCVYAEYMWKNFVFVWTRRFFTPPIQNWARIGVKSNCRKFPFALPLFLYLRYRWHCWCCFRNHRCRHRYHFYFISFFSLTFSSWKINVFLYAPHFPHSLRFDGWWFKVRFYFRFFSLINTFPLEICHSCQWCTIKIKCCSRYMLNLIKAMVKHKCKRYVMKSRTQLIRSWIENVKWRERERKEHERIFTYVLGKKTQIVC